MRKRLLETPKESGNEEVTIFFGNLSFLLLNPFQHLLLPGEQEDVESSKDPREDGQSEHI